MKRKQVLNLSDIDLDKKIKIQGTQYDRKRKLTDKDCAKASKLYNNKGYTYETLGEMFGVHPTTIKYYLDPNFRALRIKHAGGKHTGVDVCTFENRVDYKRNLIHRRKIDVKSV